MRAPRILADVALERLQVVVVALRVVCAQRGASGSPWKPYSWRERAEREGTRAAPGLLADVALERLQVIVVALRVARVVRAQRAHQDHRNQARQEDDHHEAVEDAEPVDLRKRAHRPPSGKGPPWSC